MSQLDIICYQVKLPVPEMGYIFLSHWPNGHRHSSTTTNKIKASCCRCYCLHSATSIIFKFILIFTMVFMIY